MKIKAAIFDVDGTLLDSMHYWRHMFEYYLDGFGKKPKLDLENKLKTLSMRESAQVFREDYGIEGSTEEIMAGINKVLEDQYFYNIEEKPYVREFVELLARNGVKICAATATDRYLVEAALKRRGLLSYFSRIFTCTEVGAGKEHPDIFLQAMDFLGEAQEDTVVFEDAYYAIKTAKKAGFYVVAMADETAREDEADILRVADEFHEDYSDVQIEKDGRRLSVGAKMYTGVSGSEKIGIGGSGERGEASVR